MSPRPKKIRTNIAVPRSALMTWTLAGIDPEKPKFQQIHFECDVENHPSTIHAVASDGNRLIHVWWPMKEDDVFERPFEIQTSAIELLFQTISPEKPVLSQGEDVSSYRILVETNQYLVGSDELESGFVEAGSTRISELVYPDWRSVMPVRAQVAKQTGPAEFGVDLKLIYDFYHYLKEFAPDALVKVNYASPGELGPMLFIPYDSAGEFQVMGDLSVEYVLMPCRT